MGATKVIAIIAICILTVVAAVLIVVFAGYCFRELMHDLHLRRSRKTPAQEQIEVSAKMVEIRRKRTDQDDAREQNEQLHDDMRIAVRKSALRMEASTVRLQRALEARGL